MVLLITLNFTLVLFQCFKTWQKVRFVNKKLSTEFCQNFMHDLLTYRLLQLFEFEEENDHFILINVYLKWNPFQAWVYGSSKGNRALVFA